MSVGIVVQIMVLNNRQTKLRQLILTMLCALLVVAPNTALIAQSENSCDKAMPIWTIAVSPDNAYIAAGYAGINDYSVKIWSVETGKEVYSFPYNPDGYSLTSISFSED